VRPKENGEYENVRRDDADDANIRTTDNANVTSAHGVLDDGEGYDGVLRRFQLETKMRIEG
jgi:hypothetical protein